MKRFLSAALTLLLLTAAASPIGLSVSAEDSGSPPQAPANEIVADFVYDGMCITDAGSVFAYKENEATGLREVFLLDGENEYAEISLGTFDFYWWEKGSPEDKGDYVILYPPGDLLCLFPSGLSVTRWGGVSFFTDESVCISDDGNYTLLDLAGFELPGFDYQATYTEMRVLEETGLISACRDGYYGLMDADGTELSGFVYDELTALSPDGPIRVYKNNLFGFLDLSGQPVTECSYRGMTHTMSDGLISAQNSDSLYGFLDVNGTTVIDFEYTYITSEFSDGVAFVCRWDESAGQDIHTGIDTEGNTVIDFSSLSGGQYYPAYGSSLSAGLFPVKDVFTDKTGYMNLSGELVIPCKYSYASKFINGSAVIGMYVSTVGFEEVYYGVIAPDGSYVLEPDFADLWRPSWISGGMLYGSRDKMATYQYYDLSGQDFEYYQETRMGTLIYKDNRCSLLAANGTFDPNALYEYIYPMYYLDCFAVCNEGMYALADAELNLLTDFSFGEINLDSRDPDRIAARNDTSRSGFIDSTGQTVMDFRHSGSLKNFNHGYAGGQYEIIDPQGRSLIVPSKNLECFDFTMTKNGVAGTRAYIEDEFGSYNQKYGLLRVCDIYMSELYVKKGPGKTEYDQYEWPELYGCVFGLVYENGYEFTLDYYDVTRDEASVDLSAMGIQHLTVAYGHLSTSVEINITRALTGLTVKSLPYKTSYVKGDPYADWEGLVLEGTFTTGEVEDIPFEWNMEMSGYDLDTMGPQTVTVSYRGQTVSFTISVDRYVTAIEMAELCNDTFLAGTPADSYHGIDALFTVTYDNNTRETILANWDFLFSQDSTEAGIQTITAEYRGCQATFDINYVNEETPFIRFNYLSIFSNIDRMGFNYDKFRIGDSLCLSAFNFGEYLPVNAYPQTMSAFEIYNTSNPENYTVDFEIVDGAEKTSYKDGQLIFTGSSDVTIRFTVTQKSNQQTVYSSEKTLNITNISTSASPTTATPVITGDDPVKIGQQFPGSASVIDWQVSNPVLGATYKININNISFHDYHAGGGNEMYFSPDRGTIYTSPTRQTMSGALRSIESFTQPGTYTEEFQVKYPNSDEFVTIGTQSLTVEAPVISANLSDSEVTVGDSEEFSVTLQNLGKGFENSNARDCYTFLPEVTVVEGDSLVAITNQTLSDTVSSQTLTFTGAGQVKIKVKFSVHILEDHTLDLGDYSLEKVFTFTVSPFVHKLKTTAYTIDETGNLIGGIPDQTTASAFKGNFSNDSSTVKVYFENIPLGDGMAVATGMTVNLIVGGVTHQTLTIAVAGDIDGNGFCTARDLVWMKQSLLNLRKNTPAEAMAADADGSGSFDMADLVTVKKILVSR